jgi:methyltransferase-like protein
MKKLTRKEKLIVLELLIHSFEDDKLKRFGAIGFYLSENPEISEHEILNRLNTYLSNPMQFDKQLKTRLKSLTQQSYQELKACTQQLINSIGKFMDLPGEKNQILYRLNRL